MVKRVPVWVWLTGILIFSFLLKLHCWHQAPTISRDGCVYIRLARIWYETGSFQGILQESTNLSPPPLYLYLMKCLMHLGFSAEMAGIGINLLLGTFTPLIAYGITHEVSQDKNIAVCSAFLTAVTPAMNTLSVKVQRDMIYLFFAGIAIWLLLAGVRRMKWGYWFGAGLACGCALLTRFETLEFLLIVPLALFILWLQKFYSRKKAFCYGGIFFLSFAGFMLVLSTLMRTNDSLLSNYERFCQTKFEDLGKQFDPELAEEPGK